MNDLIFEKVTEYLKLYRMDSTPQLLSQVIERVNVRLIQEDCESPLEVAIEEAQKVIDAWLIAQEHLPATTEQILLARLKQSDADFSSINRNLFNVPPLVELSMPPQKIEFWSLWQGLATLFRSIFKKVNQLFSWIIAIFRKSL